MFAPRSTHKRKRSSSRRDAAHQLSTPGRSIVSLVVPSKGKAKAKEDESESFRRVERTIGAHEYSHEVRTVRVANLGQEVS